MQTIGRTFLALLMLFAGTQIFVSGQASEKGELQEQTERFGESFVGVWQAARQQPPRGLNKTKDESVNLEISFKFTLSLFKIHPLHQSDKTRLG